MNKNQETRYCKKCGCELMSTNKKKLCENCRRERNKTANKIVAGIGVTLSAIGAVIINKEKIGKK